MGNCNESMLDNYMSISKNVVYNALGILKVHILKKGNWIFDSWIFQIIA